MKELSGTIGELKNVAGNVNSQVEKIDRLTSALETFLTGGASAAGKVVMDSKNKLACVLESIKQGIKILRNKNNSSEVN